MEPGTFEDDEDRRTERTVIGAELTGRVNGLRLLIMRGRGCADCEKACDRKRRDGRTVHPNCPFNPLRRHHSRTCNAASVGWRREGALPAATRALQNISTVGSTDTTAEAGLWFQCREGVGFGLSVRHLPLLGPPSFICPLLIVAVPSVFPTAAGPPMSFTY
jgi:hypothetical protein